MSENKHTPGGWIISRHRNGNSINGATIHNGTVIVGYVTRKADKPVTQKEADANLFASAPDMLAALEEIEEMASHSRGGEYIDARQYQNVAQAAIKKARGQ